VGVFLLEHSVWSHGVNADAVIEFTPCGSVFSYNIMV